MSPDRKSPAGKRPHDSGRPRADEAPAVCRSGLFQFAPQQTFSNGCVQSRGLFWCKDGHGRFEVDGVSYSIGPNDLFILPWGRRITYVPAPETPMFTAHVHLVPWYRPGARWEANVPHEDTEPEFNSADRCDADWSGLDGVVRLRLAPDELLGRLISYTVRWYMHTRREEAEARALGLLLVRELLRRAGRPANSTEPFPEELQRLVTHVDRCFHLGPRIAEMATMLGRSRSHVLKLFLRHTGGSAKRFVIDRQLREARELLLTTTLTVAEVGRRVGLPDAFHFSKLFHRHIGTSPREFRQRHGTFASPSRPSQHASQPPKAGS
ncbi:MAG: AraC family transcriptional regulator [Opitutaceae bacterium]